MIDFVMSILGHLPWWTWAIIGFVVICIALQNDCVGSALVLTVSMSLIVTGLWGVWSSGIPQAAVGSFAAHVVRLQKEKVRVAAIRKDGEERAYRVVCPDYFEQGWVNRKLSVTSWCEDYRDRF